MKRRPSLSTDDDAESSLESDALPQRVSPKSTAGRRSSTSRTTRSSRLNWNHANGSNGYAGSEALSDPTALPRPSLTTVHSTTNIGKERLPEDSPRPSHSLWSISRLTFITALLGIAILASIVGSFVTRPSDAKGCRMSFMRPSYIPFTDFDTEHTRFATKYSLYLYREQGIDNDKALTGIPVLFIPGNAGSYKQVRPIAADAANHFRQHYTRSSEDDKSGVRNLDFFTVDFNEDITAFHGQTLLDQAEYLNEAVRYILSLYSDPSRGSRTSDLPDPTSVIIMGHSMGGVVARAMLVQSNYLANSINTIITMSAPHARAPVTFDGQLVQIYDEINEYWRQAYTQKWANNNPLWHTTLVSIAGGSLDSIVPSDYASLESLVPPTHGFTVFSTGIPTVWTAMDHQAILWCDQFRKVVSRALLEIVDVHRASQTKPRAERMRVFKKAFLSGLETVSEKIAPTDGATVLLTLDATSEKPVPSDGRLVLDRLGSSASPVAYLLPVPSQSPSSPVSKRFTLMTDVSLKERSNAPLDVLLCSVSPSQHATVPSSHFSTTIDLSGNQKITKTLTCRNAAVDRTLLPASTVKSTNTFCLERDCQTPMFSYLHYEVSDLYDHDFIAVVDKATKPSSNFAVAEFANSSDFQHTDESSLVQLLTMGTTLEMAETRPMAVEVKVPSLKSALLAYDLTVSRPQCSTGSTPLFRPLVRQYLERPYESRYFVNVEHASVTLHGVAPYMPGALKPRLDDGLALQFWSDPSCKGPIQLRLRVNVFASLGKLYMRYRTVFAAFPLLIVTLVLRQQFRVYDNTGVFVSFSRALDLALRQSIPLLLLSLTLLSMSISGAATAATGLLRCKHSAKSIADNFHENELLIGTRDPFFWFLIPMIGVVCVGVCVILHYASLALTQCGSLLYHAISAVRYASSSSTDRARAASPAFVPSTPRRRMVTTIVLLFLVATFIPYQFAYLVACLVQLFTVTRALRIRNNISSTGNTNYYNYAHSILLLMLWVLPINLPILAVWIRNLAVHWLTPFSSHHNVLSIMPFILLVENLTTGKMVPQVTSGLRFVTSVLLFGTALCAAVYGVSHAYLLHYLVNVVAAWLVIIHSTAESWSLARLSAMFEVNPDDVRNRGKRS
ncbi:PGAP1-like protein [Sarocladium implicatum]|nr:PGAP1-like protein [Sarocladium implicatum]